MQNFRETKRNSCILYHFVLTPMGIGGLRRWSNNSRTWSHSWRSWRRSWRSRWLNSNAWRVNYQRPKHGMKRGNKRGTRGRGEQVRTRGMAIPNGCGWFWNWELPRLTEEKRAEEAETKNLELEVIGHPFSVLGPFLHSCSKRPPLNPHVFWRF